MLSTNNALPTRGNRASIVVIALIASLLVLVSPVSKSKADYIAFTAYTTDAAITYNDRVCNLGDPSTHLTSETAFEISTSEQLWEVTDCVSNSATVYFELGDDINVSQATSAPTNSPIGFSTSALAYSFRGVLDGKNKTISGLEMSTANYGVGLFAHLQDAAISNLVISGSFVTTTTTTLNITHAAGGLAIRAGGSLRLSSISNQASVTGKNNVGGLVGYVNTIANIETSFNTGHVSGSSFVGGLVGDLVGAANIVSSGNTGEVLGSDYVGGLVGLAEANGTIIFSHNTGTVSGTANFVGGLVGFAAAPKIENSFNSGTVSGSHEVGGLVGRANASANFTSSFNTGTISGTADFVGGLVGFVKDNANIHSSYNTGAVSGSNKVGGLVGLVDFGHANINSSYNTGAVFGFGFDPDDILIFSAGGLVGYVERGSAHILLSFNAGSVSGLGSAAGLVGEVLNGYATINSSYNTGAVSGQFSSGLVAVVRDSVNIDSAYNTGAITGTNLADGAVVLADDVITSSAYSSVASSFVATTPVADMKLASTYVGFDFSSANPVWGFGACSENDGFPMLRVFGAVSSYFNASCGVNTLVSSQPEQTPAQTPAPVYSGPIISGTPSAVAGTEVTLTGNRLESVTTAHVGGVQVRIVSAQAQSLTLDIPSSMVPGSYDLVLQSSFGTLTIQNGLTVLAPLDTGSVVEAANKKLTVVALKGFIAIYTKGYEGQRLSVKVAGKWLVVPEISEDWKGNNYSRTIRFAGSGMAIKVHLFVDREFVRTEELTTK